MNKVLISFLLGGIYSYIICDPNGDASYASPLLSIVNVCKTTSTHFVSEVPHEQFSTFLALPPYSQRGPASMALGTQSAFHGWLYVGLEVTIALSYFLILFVLLYFLYKRNERSEFRIALGMLMIFILVCGLAHLMDSAMLWWPSDGLRVALRVTTAIASLGTALMLMKVVPRLIELKGPEALQVIVKERTEELRRTALLVSAYQLALDESAIVATTDQNQVVKHVNENFFRVSKYSNEELIGKEYSIVNPEYHRKEFIDEVWSTVAGGKIWKGALQNRSKHGTIYWLDTTIVPVVNDTGEPYQYLIIGSDITERRKLEEQQAMYALIVNSLGDAIISKNLDGIITSWNPGAEKQFGYSWTEIIGKHISTIIPQHLQAEEEVILQKVISGESIELYETERIRKDSKLIHVSITISPIRDSTGNIVGVSKISRDISEKKKLENLLDASNRMAKIGNWEADLVQGIVYWSAVTREIHETGVDYDPSLSQGISFYKEGESRKRITECVQACIEHGTVWDEELQIVTAKGNIKWIRTIGSGEFREGKCTRFYGSFQDIDERKRAEEEIKDSEEKRRLIMGGALDAIICFDAIGAITFWNPKAKEIFGWTEADAMGKELSGLIFPEPFRKYHTDGIAHYLETGDREALNVLMELTGLTKSGEEFPMELTVIPIKQGEELFFCAFIRDITQRKGVEKELTFSKVLLENAEAQIGLGSWEMDFGTKIVKWSKQMYHLFGFEFSNQVPAFDEFLSHVHPGDRHLLQNHMAAIQKGVELPVFEYRTNPEMGPMRYVLPTWHLERDSDGNPVKISGTNLDITERRKADEKIRSISDSLRLAINASNLGIWDYSPLSNILIWDDRMYQLYGVTPATFSGAYEAWENGLHPDDKARAAEELQTAIEGGKRFDTEFRVVWPDQSVHHIKAEALVYRDEKGIATRMVGTNRDITEGKEAEEKVRRSETVYRTIASSIPGSVISLIDRDYRYFLIEGDLAEKLGYRKESLLGKTVGETVHAERYKELEPYFQRVFLGQTITVETQLDDYYLLTRYVPLLDEDQSVTSAMLVVIDVTELKRAQHLIAELNVSLEQKVIERTDQLAAVNKELESFSYSVSHDLRAPLRAVSGYAKMLEEDYHNVFNEDGRRLLRIVQENARRMGQLIDDLLAFSRLGRKEIQKSEVNMMSLTQSVVEEVTAIYSNANIKIESLHTAWGDSALLRQVLFNYVSNAVKYSSKSENPVVRITSEIVNESTVYSVSDNGAGFDMNYAHKLFQVFQRLHGQKEFEGTGVGLAIVARIIGKHGGKVWAQGEIGRGATFFFSLPIESRNKHSLNR
jgi:PAS domain S-box-containing protein